MENIVIRAINDINNKRELTEEQATKIIEGAIARVKKVAEKNAPEINNTQIGAMVSEYRKQYKKAKDAVNQLRDDFSIVLGMGQGMSEAEINKELRGLMQAYAKTKPHKKQKDFKRPRA